MTYLEVLDRTIALVGRDLEEDELVVLTKLIQFAKEGDTADDVSRRVADIIADRPVVADSELHTSRFEARRDTVAEVPLPEGEDDEAGT